MRIIYDWLENTVEETKKWNNPEVTKKVLKDIKDVNNILNTEDRVNAKTLGGWEVYFNPQNDIAWQTTKLEAVLAKHIPAEKREILEYIDVRFGNLAPFKFQE